MYMYEYEFEQKNNESHKHTCHKTKRKILLFKYCSHFNILHKFSTRFIEFIQPLLLFNIYLDENERLLIYY